MKYRQKRIAAICSGLGFMLISGCSNQVETSGNTIPASTGSPQTCCTQGNTGNQTNTSGYNVLDNPRTQVQTNTTTNTNTQASNTASNNTQAGNTTQNTSAGSTGGNTGGGVDYSYYDYGGSNASSTTATNTSYDYSSSNTASNAGAGSTAAADGRPSVQVLASGNYQTAQGMQQQMRSAGYPAVVVQDAGLYKVRVPYGSYQEAKSRLNQIRSIAPDAFVSR